MGMVKFKSLDYTSIYLSKYKIEAVYTEDVPFEEGKTYRDVTVIRIGISIYRVREPLEDVIKMIST